ncbi:hypothetical protein HY772_01735 [Candidatus Woesearchaeota archaeon]|nr:hypothetical protein [Candidatus Woesearchaeota archaeon]
MTHGKDQHIGPRKIEKIISLAAISAPILSLTAFFVFAQTKQELVAQVNDLIVRADDLLAQAGGAAPEGGGFFSSPWAWIPLLLIGAYVIWMLAQHARYRYFHGLDTHAVDERIKSLLQIARDKLRLIHQTLPQRALTSPEEEVWRDTVDTVTRRWGGTTGVMRWPVRDRLIRRIIRNGISRNDAHGNLIFVPELRDILPAGPTPANPARTRLMEDIEACLAAILVAQQLLRDELGRYFYPRILRVNAWERRLQRHVTSPVIHSTHNVTFTYDTRLGAPGITEVRVFFPNADPKAREFVMNRSADGQIFTFTTTVPCTAGDHTYYFMVARGAAPIANEFDPLNMNRTTVTAASAGSAPPIGGVNRFTI